MKRFHIHLAVQQLDSNVDFYSALFGQAPSKLKDDYAKWQLEEPRINFAVSTRSDSTGLDHLGFEVDSSEELTQLKQRAEAATPDQVLDQGNTTCCYANSEKHWTTDPQGIAWEHFRNHSDATSYNDPSKQLVNPSDHLCCSANKTNDDTSTCCE